MLRTEPASHFKPSQKQHMWLLAYVIRSARALCLERYRRINLLYKHNLFLPQSRFSEKAARSPWCVALVGLLRLTKPGMLVLRNYLGNEMRALEDLRRKLRGDTRISHMRQDEECTDTNITGAWGETALPHSHIGAVSPVLEATRSTFSLGSVSRPFHTHVLLFPSICTCPGDQRCF